MQEEVIPICVTRREAARKLGISLRTLDYLLSRKELVRRKIGSRTVIPMSSLLAFLRKDHPTGNEAGR